MLGRFRRWLASDRRAELRQNPPCPRCGRTVVGRVGSHVRPGGRRAYLAPTREELVAHCPVHGRPPYNLPTELPTDLPTSGPSHPEV